MERLKPLIVAAAALIAIDGPAIAAEPEAPADTRNGQSAGADFFYSSDSEESETARAGLNLDLLSSGPDSYLGVRVEKAWFNPQGSGWQGRERLYLRAAQAIGGWQARAQVGTDGDTVLGSIAVNDRSRFRKEFFLERDIVETPRGLAEGLYATFAGAAIDLPVDDRNIFTALAGIQAFSGDNERLHLRGSYVHVVKPEWGLSAQLRGRWFRSSVPGEYHYYSPRWYAEVLPVAQLRRFSGGWELVGAAGLGVQRDSESGWRRSNYLHARFRSPQRTSGWSVNGAFTYTNTPSANAASASGYSYVQFMVGASVGF